MNRRRTLGAIGIGVTAATMITACAAPASRYRTDAMAFIADDTMFDAYRVDFENIECEEPDSTDEGATVECRADGDDGQSYTFTFTIVGTNQLELTQIGLAGLLASGDPDASEPASTAPVETAPEPADETAGSVSAAPITTAAESAVTAPAPAAPVTTAAATTVPATTAAAATTAATTTVPATTTPVATTTTAPA